MKILSIRSLLDVLIEPIRSILIPGFDLVKQKTKEVGALGGGISGSGPSIFMLSRDEKTANKIALEMTAIYSSMGLDHHTYVTTVNQKGIQLIEA